MSANLYQRDVAMASRNIDILSGDRNAQVSLKTVVNGVAPGNAMVEKKRFAGNSHKMAK